MATVTTDNIQVELTYTDYVTRNYKIPLQSGAVTQAVAKIKAFNAAASDPTSSVTQTFLSESGAPVAGITAAIVIHREEEEIYHA